MRSASVVLGCAALVACNSSPIQIELPGDLKGRTALVAFEAGDKIEVSALDLTTGGAHLPSFKGDLDSAIQVTVLAYPQPHDVLRIPLGPLVPGVGDPVQGLPPGYQAESTSVVGREVMGWSKDSTVSALLRAFHLPKVMTDPSDPCKVISVGHSTYAQDPDVDLRDGVQTSEAVVTAGSARDGAGAEHAAIGVYSKTGTLTITRLGAPLYRIISLAYDGRSTIFGIDLAGYVVELETNGRFRTMRPEPGASSDARITAGSDGLVVLFGSVDPPVALTRGSSVSHPIDWPGVPPQIHRLAVASKDRALATVGGSVWVHVGDRWTKELDDAIDHAVCPTSGIQPFADDTRMVVTAQDCGIWLRDESSGSWALMPQPFLGFFNAEVNAAVLLARGRMIALGAGFEAWWAGDRWCQIESGTNRYFYYGATSPDRSRTVIGACRDTSVAGHTNPNSLLLPIGFSD